MQDDGWEVPNKINSWKNPPKLKKVSTSLADYKGNLADLPDGIEVISVTEPVDMDEKLSAYEDKEDDNDYNVSSDDDSSPEVKVVNKRILHQKPGDSSVSTSNSDDDSDSSSDQKKPAKNEGEDKIKPAFKRQKTSQRTSPTKASATQNVSVLPEDYAALLPRMCMNFGTEPYFNFMLGKFALGVANDAIIAFCYAYNLNEIPEKIFVGYEPFFGVLKIYTIGVEKHMKYFQLLKDSKYAPYLYVCYSFDIHYIKLSFFCFFFISHIFI
jgi:hypothetical protein